MYTLVSITKMNEFRRKVFFPCRNNSIASKNIFVGLRTDLEIEMQSNSKIDTEHNM